MTATPKLPYSVEQRSRNVTIVRMDIESQTDWSQRFLLRSDAHNDNPFSDRKMQARHLDEAVATGAGVIDNGDMMCLMEGKFDKRADQGRIHPNVWKLMERKANDHDEFKRFYLDAVAEETAEFYSPWARNFIVVGKGNHETAISKRHEICMTTRVVERMNAASGGNTQVGGYGGWVWFQFRRGKQRISKRLHHHHGHGGGGPVTKGVIQTNRRQTMVKADFIMTGHIHESWNVTIPWVELDGAGKVVHRVTEHISTPTYKEEFQDGAEGYHNENGRPPKPIGAYWLDFYWAGNRGLRHRLYRAD